MDDKHKEDKYSSLTALIQAEDILDSISKADRHTFMQNNGEWLLVNAKDKIWCLYKLENNEISKPIKIDASFPIEIRKLLKNNNLEFLVPDDFITKDESERRLEKSNRFSP